jgi:hypothetical protein
MEAILKTKRTYEVTFENGETKTVEAYGCAGAVSKAIEGAYSPSENRLMAVKELTPLSPEKKKCFISTPTSNPYFEEDDWREGLSDDKIGKLENMARDDMDME